MLRATNLAKRYRSTRGRVDALDGVSIDAQPGEFLALRGPSGCGKSTLLLTLGGMLHPTEGEVWVDGQNVYQLGGWNRARFRGRRIGFVFQLFHLVPYLNVLDNVRIARRKGEAEPPEALLERLGLAHRLRHTPAELSAGERQRTAIARALINKPALVLADEPTGNLDPENARHVLEHLRSYAAGGGVVLMATHSDEASAAADRVVGMSNGQLRRDK
jgi:ABC-type lipoprotein export system ATPase subunit